MLDSDRVLCVLELLKSFDNGSKIASKLIQNYFRSNKNIGSKDRKFISNCFWNIIKHRNKINWHLENHNIKVNFERQIILELFFLNVHYKNDLQKIKNFFFLNNKFNKNFKDDVVDTISETCSQLEGTFSCWIFDAYENDIYIVRCGSTLFYNKDGDISSKQPDDSWATIKEGEVYKLIKNNFVSVGSFKTNSPYFIL